MAIKDSIKNWLGIEKAVTHKSTALVSDSFFEREDFRETEALKSYSDNTWVHACVSLRAEAFADGKFFMVNSSTGERFNDHPAIDFLNNPSPFYTRFEIMSYLSMHEDLTGDAYWAFDRTTAGKIISVQPLLPQFVTPILEDDEELIKAGKFVKQYEYLLDGKQITLPAANVMHFKSVSPLELIEGVGDVFAASFAVDNEKHSNAWNLNFFKNGARMGTVLESENTIDPDSAKRMIQQFNDKYAGSKNAWKTALLTGGVKMKDGDSTHSDMEFSMLQDNNRDKILAAFRCPRQLIGGSVAGSLAEAETAEFVFSKYVTTPKLERFIQKLNKELLPKLGVKGMWIRFESPVPENKEFELAKLDSGLNQWMTINERREVEGFEPLVGGDELLQPLNLMPLEDIAAGSTFTEEETVAPVTDEKKKLKDALQRSKIKKLGTPFKQRYMEKFLLGHGLIEAKMIRKLQREFAKQRAETLKKLNNAKEFRKTKSLSDDVFNEAGLIKTFAVAMSGMLLETMLTNANAVADTFGLGVQILSTDASVKKFIKTQSIRMAKEVTETTAKQIREAISTGLSEEEAIPEISKRVKNVFKKAIDSRAVMIARTETTKFSNGGALIAYEESGVVEKKEWITTLDGRERAEHQAANGQIVKAKDAFDVGGEDLQFPSDPNGSAGNVINCRCTVIPVIDNL